MDILQELELGGLSLMRVGADQRLCTACLLGQNTNSNRSLAAAALLYRVHLENTEACVSASDICSYAFNTFSPSFLDLRLSLKTSSTPAMKSTVAADPHREI